MSNTNDTKKRKASPAALGMDADLLASKRAQSRKSSQKHRLKQSMLAQEMTQKQVALKRRNEDLKTENQKMKDQIALLKGYGYGKKAAAMSICTDDFSTVSSISRASTVTRGSSVLSRLANIAPQEATPRLQMKPMLASTVPAARQPAAASVNGDESVAAALQEAIEAVRAQSRIVMERAQAQLQLQDLLESTISVQREQDLPSRVASAARADQSSATANLLSLLAAKRQNPASGRSLSHNDLLLRSFLNRASSVITTPHSAGANLSLYDLSQNQIEQLILLRLQELNYAHDI